MKFCGMVGRLAIGINQVDFDDNLHLDPGILKEFYLCRIGNGKGSSLWVRKFEDRNENAYELQACHTDGA